MSDVRRYEKPCKDCPASEECWNYGYSVATNERINWFDCHMNVAESPDAPVLTQDAASE